MEPYRRSAEEFRLVAEEFRVLAEECVSDAARRTYLRLAAEQEAAAMRADDGAKASVAERLVIYSATPGRPVVFAGAAVPATATVTAAALRGTGRSEPKDVVDNPHGQALRCRRRSEEPRLVAAEAETETGRKAFLQLATEYDARPAAGAAADTEPAAVERGEALTHASPAPNERRPKPRRRAPARVPLPFPTSAC